MIRWGTRGRKQRWKCLDCRKTQVQKKQQQECHQKYFSYFKLWITTQTPFTVLEKLAKVSSKTLQRHFDTFLCTAPDPLGSETKCTSVQKIWLKIDGTYFTDWGCVIVYKAGKDILYWQYAEKEQWGVYEAGLKWLVVAGYIIEGITTDWHGSIISAVGRICSDIPHQRCLVHTKRLCQTLLTQKPQTEAGWMLLRIVRELNTISNEYEKKIWMRWLEKWKKRHGHLIKERTYSTTSDGRKTWWYTHKNLRRAFLTIWNTQDHLFLYLTFTGLEKDTNGLEAEFKHMKAKIRSHAGMRKTERRSYISWYLFFKSP